MHALQAASEPSSRNKKDTSSDEREPSSSDRRRRVATTDGDRRTSFDCHLHDWYLHGEDESSLQRFYKNDLAALCKQRGLDCAGGSKADLIDALLHWVCQNYSLRLHVSSAVIIRKAR